MVVPAAAVPEFGSHEVVGTDRDARGEAALGEGEGDDHTGPDRLDLIPAITPSRPHEHPGCRGLRRQHPRIVTGSVVAIATILPVPWTNRRS